MTKLNALHPRDDLERISLGDELEPVVRDRVLPLFALQTRDAVARRVAVLDEDLLVLVEGDLPVTDLVADRLRLRERRREVVLEPVVVDVVFGVRVAAVLVVARAHELQETPDVLVLDRVPILLTEGNDLLVLARVLDVGVGDVRLRAADTNNCKPKEESDNGELLHALLPPNTADLGPIPA